MSQAGPILVPLDGSPAALAALPAARAIARLTGAPIRVLHVAEQPLGSAELGERLGLLPSDLAGLILEPARGRPAETINRVAGDANCTLVILTPRGRSARREAAGLGSTARALLRDAARPLLFVLPHAPAQAWPTRPLRRLLLPLTGGPLTVCSARWVTQLAGLAHAELEVLVLAGAGAPAEPSPLALPRYVDQPQQEWPAWFAEFAERFYKLLGERPSTSFRVVAAAGQAAPAIVSAARRHDADLVALFHQPTGAPVLAEAVLAEAPCPVLVLQAAGTTTIDLLLSPAAVAGR